MIALLLHYKYFIMLALMFVEWPIVSFVCAFMAAQWFFSFGIVYVLSIFGDLIGDVLWYSVGRLARKLGAKKMLVQEEKGVVIDPKTLSWKGRFNFRVTNKIYKIKDASLSTYIHERATKNFFFTLFLIKITPPLSVPGQISLGFIKTPFKKFLLQTTILIIVFESVFLNLGYFSSMSINTFKNNLDTIGWIVSVVVIGWLSLWIGFLIIKKMRTYSKVR